MKKTLQTTTLGSLISNFSLAKREASRNAEQKLWDRNKLGNPTQRGGHEVRETSVNMNGKTIITQQLWKKVDEIRVVVSSHVDVQEVEPESVEDLLK